MLQGWSDVVSTDKKVAVVADVFTAAGENVAIDDKCVLYEGVGPAYEIYVVVEIDGLLYLTRGSVFSYREFTRLMSDPTHDGRRMATRTEEITNRWNAIMDERDHSSSQRDECR